MRFFYFCVARILHISTYADMKERILQALATFKGYLFSSDKWLHLAAGFIIAFLVGLLGAFYGLCAGVMAAAGKELYDKISKKGTPEIWDFIFSVVGVVAGVLSVLLARLVFHFIA